MSEWTKKQRRVWATTQRQLRRCGLLSSERIQKLDSEGFDWGEVEKRVRNSATNKIRLLEIARSGESRPKWDSKLSRALRSYTLTRSSCYDPDFDKEIRQVKPLWFEGKSAVKKAELLEMARNGEPKPKWGSLLSVALNSYVSRSNGSYDSDFDREIKHLALQWWEDTAAINKAQLLEMARNGETKPSRKAPLGGVLSHYTCSKSGCYDADFDREIRKAAPEWFEDKSAINKAKLLEMARNGEPKPYWKTPLGLALSSYISKGSSYDADFDHEIKEAAPQWFEDTATINKVQLLEMARDRKPRPKSKTPVGSALCTYTSKRNSSYDPVFDEKIRHLAPQWWEDTAAINKVQLLEMARNGEMKPSRDTPLGAVLRNYIDSRGRACDPDFDKEIRSLAPQWFKRSNRGGPR